MSSIREVNAKADHPESARTCQSTVDRHKLTKLSRSGEGRRYQKAHTHPLCAPRLIDLVESKITITNLKARPSRAPDSYPRQRRGRDASGRQRGRGSHRRSP
jgi:hypothetical protein